MKAGLKISSKLQDYLSGNRPPFEKFYPYVLTALVGFLIADLALVETRNYMLPEKASPAVPRQMKSHPIRPRSYYSSVIERNLFNSDGVIPPALKVEGSGGGDAGNADPVLTQLPLELIGTIVHVNPKKSLATITNRSSGLINSYLVGDDMDGMGELIRVERMRAVFRNANTRRLEYVELNIDSTLTFGMRKGTPSTSVGQAGEIVRTGNTFTLMRTDLKKYLTNVNDILTQARAVPNMSPDGKVDGFKLVAIQPNSVFNKLGLERMDVIREVNGELVDSANKAIELYQKLQESEEIKLKITRNGKDMDFQYRVVE